MIHKWATRRPARGGGGPRHGRRAAGTHRRRLLSALVLALDAALASSGSCLDRLCGSARLGGAIDAHLLKIVIEEELGFRVELVRRRIVGRFLTSKEAIFCHRNEAPFYPWCLVAHTVHSSATFHRSQMALVPSSPSSTESMISTRCSMQYAMPYPATEAQHASALTCRALVLSRWVLSDGRPIADTAQALSTGQVHVYPEVWLSEDAERYSRWVTQRGTVRSASASA